MELLNVTAVLVTRGDHDTNPVIDSLPSAWEAIVWDNGRGIVERHHRPGNLVADVASGQPDLSVYGRYAAIEYARHDLIFTVDDDVIVSDPQAIVDAWKPGHVVCNMPAAFRRHYNDSALVGFGACFERHLPQRAFKAYESWPPGPRMTFAVPDGHPAHWRAAERNLVKDPAFLREADTVFTTLTPRILVDVPKTDREFASDPDRLWKQPEHGEMRRRMLELARQVRDA